MSEDVQNDLKEIKELLTSINRRLDLLESEAAFNRRQWKESKSFGRYAKQWGGFYLASLMADETLGLHGNNSANK